MKTARKVLLLVLCAALLVSASVMGTLAYLTSTTGPVTNTMSYGKVTITLDEAKTDINGDEVIAEGATKAERVTANSYKLIPGHNYAKDPTIHVAEDSENCWIFVKVENAISAIEADYTIAAQMAENGWTEVATGIYAYKDIVTAGKDVVVFKEFTVKGDADVSTYEGKTIVITGYAIQADGFDTAAEAWTAAKLA